ncbi:TonB-dependent receptor [Hyphomonas sp.]|uniref:TonB-dependent receptor n=1 Tax=Hyphomonas sp. TaxID=87 RepID=UPI001BD0611A|nr:TonB-dependent receptor [Hyphomonas sp.]
MTTNKFRAVLLGSIAPFLAISGVGSTAQAQTGAADTLQATGEVTGVVSDAVRGVYLVGAEVRITGLNIVAVTDSEGRYSFRQVPLGQQTVEVSYLGRPTRQARVTVTGGEPALVDVVLGATGEDDRVMESIIVLGARPQAESEAAALQVQRSSKAIVNVVAADSIGNFPDQNIAAAIGRLPGVAVGRDQGQERTLSLRGAPSRWTSIAFDGVNVIAPGGKSARTDTVPAAIASSVIVRKAVTPAMPGESLAGNIDIITRGAFDYPGPKAALNTAVGYNELGGGEQYDIGGFVSNTFADGRIGLLLSASRYEREMITDNFETDWETGEDSEDREAGFADRAWADAHQNKLYRLTRSNTAYSGRLDFRPSDAHRFFFSSIYTEFTDDELRNAMEFDLDDGARDTDEAAITRGYADIRTGNTPFQGRIFAVELDSTLNSNRTLQSIFTNTLGGEQRFGDWDASWRLNYSNSLSESGPTIQSAWRSPRGSNALAGRPTVIYDFTDPENHRVELFETIVNPDGSLSQGESKRNLDAQDYEFVRLRNNDRLQDSYSYSARLDLGRELTLFDRATEFQFGVQYDDRSKKDTRQTLEITAAQLAAAGIAAPSRADIEINDPYKGELPLGYSFRYFSDSAIRQLWNGLADQGVSRVQANTSETNNFRVTENVIAGYAMTTTYFDWGNILAGARVERVENTGRALVRFGNNFELANVGDDSLQVFPSMHVNWDINDQLKLRLSANSGAARPDFSILRPNFNVSDENQTISGGNPFALPEKAIGADGYLEWYLPSGAFLSFGAYYKSLDDVLFSVRNPAFGSDVLNEPGIDRSGYVFTTTDNGGSGYLAGAEVAFSQTLEPFADRLNLPEWAGGFGVRGNLTLNDSEVETPDGRKVQLPGSSDLIYNAALSYERYGLSTRISWQYQTEYIDSIGSGDVLGDGFWSDVGRLDFKTEYTFNDNAQVYFEANNLTREPGVRYEGIVARTSEYEEFGARYLLGLRLNF